MTHVTPYRCFISNYSDIVIPLTWLTHKGILWNFTNAARKSFQALKSAFTSAPVLTHWVPDKPIIVETNASDYALGAILSIQTDSGEIHPVAFHSHTFSAQELNYDTHDKEYFSTTKVLTRCQAHWSKYLSQFNLVIRFCPGKLGTKPDSLTRCWDIYPKEIATMLPSIQAISA